MRCRRFTIAVVPQKHLIPLFLILIVACAELESRADDAKPPAVAPQGYHLVWSDDFNYTGPPDPAKWTYEKGFVRNNEPQIYTDRPENVRVEGGHLIIEARKERLKNPNVQPDAKSAMRRQEFADFTSASVTTYGLGSWTYGRFEMRAKLPNAKGDWPAFWMLGDSRNEQGRRQPWPLCGETDIMELWGARNPDVVQAHLIWEQKEKTVAEGGPLKITDPSKNWHVYAVNWYPDRMDFYVDDTKYRSIKIDAPGKIAGDAFHRPQYMLLNLALEPKRSRIDESIFPQQYIVDYVRVYQKRNAP
jgi:beta-glucanase (GH16 family)